MLKVYVMPNGKKYRFKDGDVPAGAELYGEKKAEPKNKAVTPANKKRKAAKK